jgi:hypothetical protein
MRKLLVLACILSLLVSAVVLAGCGGGSSSSSISSSSQTPQQVTQAFYDALRKADANATWNMMSSDSQKLLMSKGGKSEWESEIKQQSTTLSNVKFTLGKATVNGNNATVVMTATVNGQTTTGPVPLIKENGVWKVDMTKSSTPQ